MVVQAAVGTAANEKCLCAFSAILVHKHLAHSTTDPAVQWIDSGHMQ